MNIPDEHYKKVPTHKAHLPEEKNKLILSRFPFDRPWNNVSLRSNIRRHLPKQDMMFEFVKVDNKHPFYGGR